VAVIENPYAGKYVEDLSELMAIGEELGELLTERAVSCARNWEPRLSTVSRHSGCLPITLNRGSHNS